MRWVTTDGRIAVKLRPRTHLARNLRRNATDAERRLWRALHEADLARRFRRQHPIGRRIVDFACPACKLAIELDGGQHADDIDADVIRSAELANHGYRVIRFWNNDVVRNLEGVVEMIRRALVVGPPPHRQTPSAFAASPPPGAERFKHK
jgi:BirA family biotin operon repressor/biotin-[acetyl-CoA-carboxylase] ligase